MDLLCVVKTTIYQRYQKDNKWKQLPTEYGKEILELHWLHMQFLSELKRIAQGLELQITYIGADKLNEVKKNYDLIITAGGDGTFLAAAQKFSTPLLAFNSMYLENPKKGSIGALTVGNRNHLAPLLAKLKAGKYKIENWKRLYAAVDRKKLPWLAVNDVFVGNPHSFKSSDLEILYKSQQERYNCSGIVVSTAAGSKAWHRSLGGKPFPREKEVFSFHVREANLDRKPQFVAGRLKDEEELTVVPRSKGYVLSFDSRGAVSVPVLSCIKIGLSEENPVRVVRF